MHTFWNVSYHHSVPIQWYLFHRETFSLFFAWEKVITSAKDSLRCDWFCEFMQNTSIHERREEVMQRKKSDTLMNCDALCSCLCSSLWRWNMHFIIVNSSITTANGRYSGEKICIYSWNWSISVLRTGVRIHALKTIVRCYARRLPASMLLAEKAHFHVYESASRIFFFVIIYSMFW